MRIFSSIKSCIVCFIKNNNWHSRKKIPLTFLLLLIGIWAILFLFGKAEEKVKITLLQADMLHFDIDDENSRTKQDEWRSLLNNSDKYKMIFIDPDGNTSSISGSNKGEILDTNTLGSYRIDISNNKNSTCIVYGEAMMHNDDFSWIRSDEVIFIRCKDSKNDAKDFTSHGKIRNASIDSQNNTLDSGPMGFIGEDFKMKASKVTTNENAAVLEEFAMVYN